jgi:hypothetical protein
MDDFIRAIELDLASKNWYAALFVALCIPDICGYLEDPHLKSECRYERWFERYMLPKYRSAVGPGREVHTFLHPSDCYALRCALLHSGRDSIIEQKAREALDKFHFISPPDTGLRHLNQRDKTLQLQVDVFCREMVDGLRQWLIETKGNQDIESNMSNMLKIHEPGPVVF